MANPRSSSSRKKNAKVVQKGRIYINATFNNTLVTVTDDHGNTISSSSTGAVGFTGSRKSTPYAATVAIETGLDRAREMGMRSADLYIKGAGPGRDAVLRVIRNSGISLGMIADVTPIPHNGTKARKMKHG
jgi:small subunit ribosomal protein S11